VFALQAEHGLPNAFMASEPRHPFWIFALRVLLETMLFPDDPALTKNWFGRVQVEQITGARWGVRRA
jgi:hypothetical protein